MELDDAVLADPLDDAEGISRRRLMLLAAGAVGAAALGTAAVGLAAPAGAATRRPPKPTLPPALGTVAFPTIGVSRTLYNTVTPLVLNKGQLGLWSGTPAPSPNPGHSLVFGHRTSAGGPLRNLNRLQPGQPVFVNGMTFSVYNWETCDARDLAHIFTSPLPDRSVVTFVACSKPNGLPTSLKYRILLHTFL